MSKVRPLVHSDDFERATWHSLLLPSWLSGFLAVTISLAFVAAIIVGLQINGSSIQNIYRTESEPTLSSIVATYHHTNQRFASNKFVSSAPLFVFWACLGLLVYAFASNVVTAFRSVADLGVEMEYANADRHALLMTALERVITRILAALLLFVFLRFSLLVVVPYIGALGHITYTTGNLALSVIYFLWAVAAGVVCFHVGTVLVRMFALRARLLANF